MNHKLLSWHKITHTSEVIKNFKAYKHLSLLKQKYPEQNV